MNNKLFRFPFVDMPVDFTMSGVIYSGFIWVALIIVALLLTELTLVSAIIAGLLGVLAYWLTDVVHQYGHFVSSRRTGYPFERVETFWFIAKQIYPDDDPGEELPPQVHIQRAIGGPIIGALYTLILFIIAWLFWDVGGIVRFALGWAFIESLLLNIASVFPPFDLPILKNDGAVLLENWRKLREQDSAA